jgi:CHAD domain-containing protein
MAREKELKFLVGPEFKIPPLDAAGTSISSVVELPTQALLAVYYDTPDLRLARSGLTLRRRTGEAGSASWTVKVPTIDDPDAREEVSYDAGPGEPPPEAKALVTAFVRGEELREVTRLRTKRLRWSLVGTGGKTLGELMDDRVSVLNGRMVIDRFREIEVESSELSDDGLKKIELVMLRAGASPPELTPKAVRALGVRAQEPPDGARPSWPGPDESAAEAVKACIASALHRLITHDPAARLGEPEGVHQMRVAMRRLRSDLRTFAPVVDEDWSNALRSELKWLADLLGPARDADVLLERLKREGHDLGEALAPLFAELERSDEYAGERLKEGLASSRYIALLNKLLMSARSPQVLPEGAEPCGKVVPTLVDVVWRPLARQGRALKPDSPDEDFHAVRIQAKRVRYAAEMAAECLGPQSAKEAAKFARRAAEIQNELGEHQDAAVARRQLLEGASRWPEDHALSFALGRLVERQSIAARGGQERFFKLWKKFDQKGMRTWLTRQGRR